MHRFLLLFILLCSACGSEYDQKPPEIEDELTKEELTFVQPARTTDSTGLLVTPPEKLGMCREKDHAIFKKNEKFSKTWGACARDWKVRGDKIKTTNCLRTTFPRIKDKCAFCFGAFAQCGKDHCFSQCWLSGGTSEDCKRCGWQNCGVALEKCTGYKRTEFYEYY